MQHSRMTMRTIQPNNLLRLAGNCNFDTTLQKLFHSVGSIKWLNDMKVINPDNTGVLPGFEQHWLNNYLPNWLAIHCENKILSVRRIFKKPQYPPLKDSLVYLGSNNLGQ